jgi:hypothetical protein
MKCITIGIPMTGSTVKPICMALYQPDGMQLFRKHGGPAAPLEDTILRTVYVQLLRHSSFRKHYVVDWWYPSKVGRSFTGRSIVKAKDAMLARRKFRHLHKSYEVVSVQPLLEPPGIPMLSC